MTNEPLNKEIAEYEKLKTYHDNVEKRLEALKKRIKQRLIMQAAAGGSMLRWRENITYYTPGYSAELIVKKKEPVPEQGQIDQLFTEKKLWVYYSECHIPEHAVEQAYLSGELTDEDLRSLKGETQYELALRVRKMEKKNV